MMTKKRLTNLINSIALFAAIAALYALVGCPFRYLTGVCCPGCGMTRAVRELAALDFAAAYRCHPLVFALPAAAAVFLLRKRLPRRALAGLCLLGLALMLSVYALRLGSGSEIVYFDPASGAVARLFRHITGR